MYVVDITRTKDELDSDMLVGKDSMDTKAKIMNYVSNFILSNYSIYVDRDLLDQHLNIELFFLKDFMKNNYNLNIDKNLIIQSVHTDKEHCLFVKFFNKNLDDFPTIYMLEKNDLDNARKIMTYITNDELINKFQDDLSLYDKNKLDYDMNMDSYSFAGVECNIISLYDSGGMFLEELLNNNYSLKDINKNDLGGIDI
jgi:hypothetical protein